MPCFPRKVFNFSCKLTNHAFSSQICKTFCHNLKKSSLFYLLFYFSALFSEKKVFNFSRKLTNLAFSSQIFKTFCQNLKKKQPILPIILFQCRVFLEKSLISHANWQIPLFQAKFSKPFVTIWKKAAYFTYYCVSDLPKKSL